jgi:hypothetical protein
MSGMLKNDSDCERAYYYYEDYLSIPVISQDIISNIASVFLNEIRRLRFGRRRIEIHQAFTQCCKDCPA